MKVIGYTYEADYHCTDCANERFSNVNTAIDAEGNPVHPIFDTDEVDEDAYCGTCLERLE